MRGGEGNGGEIAPLQCNYVNKLTACCQVKDISEFWKTGEESFRKPCINIKGIGKDLSIILMTISFGKANIVNNLSEERNYFVMG